MNHQQWENTVRDLFRLPTPSGLSTAFVAEPLRSSFDTNGTILTVSPDLWGDYQTAAEAMAKRVARTPALLTAVSPTGVTDPAAKAKAFVENIGLRAFRRPLTATESTRYLALFNKGPMLFATTDAFADGVELVLSAFLQSPNFLYRTEISSNVVAGVVPLNGYEVAARLSYGLTNSMPDDVLMGAAANLNTRDAVLEQARRILATPAAQQTVANFHDQLLLMREYDALKKDATAPLFTGAAADLKSENQSFIKDVVFTQSKGLTELLTAPYTFANSRIAKMYGLTATTPPAGQPDPFKRVELDPTQRAGFLTQVGFLATWSEGVTPNIIMRGVHMAHDVLCLDLPAPPDMVPPLPALMANSTNRQRVQELTKNAPCSGCHATVINPLGFGFENLDGFGKYRTTENNMPIDATGTYQLDGKDFTFNGAASLIKAFADTAQAHDCYSSHWVEYLYGRDIDLAGAADKNLVTQAGLRSKANTSVKDLLLNLVSTDAFLTRLP